MDSSSSNCDRWCSDPDEDADQSVDLISREFNRKLDLKCNDDSEAGVDDEDHEGCDNNNKEEDEDDDDDFTFMFIGDDDAPIYDDGKLLLDQTRPAFPLFDQKLLLDGEYKLEEIDRLPILPPVDKIFIESPRRIPSETQQNEDDTATGRYCAWSGDSATAATAELSKKSNSTGFSKLWRLKEKVGRSNSDGRDAFVFLRSSISSAAEGKEVRSDGTFVKVKIAGGKARVVKQAKKRTVSAHEAYLRSRGGQTEEERRRSYLPYRPELMGLFTNVHGGLTKNVHPY